MPEMLLAHTGDPDSRTSIRQAILQGYAPDGELYVPHEYPAFSDRELYALQGEKYATVFYETIKKFLSDVIPDEELRQISEESYSPDVFDFEDGRLRLNQLPSGLYVAGLSDGPTGAFKDMAMQPFARLVEAIRAHGGVSEILDLLVATSGDTGPAAQHAFGAVDGIRSFTMFPRGEGTSRVQRGQMIGMHNGDNIHSLEVDADFSDINDIHMRLEKEFEVGAVNSVNIARLIAQVAYHVGTYLETIEHHSKAVFGDPIDISIPSGNFGNGLAAIIARHMGVPIRNIIIATNENDALSRYFNEGVYTNVPAGSEKHTDSSAQDIRNASNIWRYFDMVYGARNAEIWQEWSANGAVDLSKLAKPGHEYARDIKATTVNGIARAAMMWNVWEDSKHTTMIDPHTANAVVGGEKFRDMYGVPMVAYETAKPFKFPDTMKFILGVEAPVPDRFIDVETKATDKEVPQLTNEDAVRGYLHENGVREKKA